MRRCAGCGHVLWGRGARQLPRSRRAYVRDGARVPADPLRVRRGVSCFLLLDAPLPLTFCLGDSGLSICFVRCARRRVLARDRGTVPVTCDVLLTVLPTCTALHSAASLAARMWMHAPHHGHASRRAAPSQRPEHDGGTCVGAAPFSYPAAALVSRSRVRLAGRCMCLLPVPPLA